jgi:tocopherol O-methyltransferase
MALHYGIWHENTRSLSEALHNTNQTLSDLGSISHGDFVLDAGCGVGGSSIFLAKEKGCRVKGITLSNKQVQTAKQNVEKSQLQSSVEILKMDYTKTTFADNSFDVVWACESISSLASKPLFAKEAFRVLKPKGRLVIADFYRTSEDANDLLTTWSESWAMAELVTIKNMQSTLEDNKLVVTEVRDYTDKILKTSKRLYQASLLGKYPSLLYNLLFGASHYAKNHYKSGFHQFHALQKGLWKYHVLLAEKR